MQQQRLRILRLQEITLTFQNQINDRFDLGVRVGAFDGMIFVSFGVYDYAVWSTVNTELLGVLNIGIYSWAELSTI